MDRFGAFSQSLFDRAGPRLALGLPGFSAAQRRRPCHPDSLRRLSGLAFRRHETRLDSGDAPGHRRRSDPGLRPLLGDAILLTAVRVRVLVAAGIVYLMAAKMPFAPSLAVLTVALILGL